MDFEKRKAKKEKGEFVWEDLANYVKERTSKDKGVVVLRDNKWVRVGDAQLLLKERSSDMDNSWALIVTRPHNPWLNWLVLTVAKIYDKGQWIRDWDICPNTNAIFDVWYIGDGSAGVYLVAQTK